MISGGTTVLAGPAGAGTRLPFEIQSLDGGGNNLTHPAWGESNTNYSRVALANYADGRSKPVDGPSARYVSNRVFADTSFDKNGRIYSANLFAKRNVTQWGWTWGQFMDHTIGLRLGDLPTDPQGETQNIPVDNSDPMEDFRHPPNDPDPTIPFTRSAPAKGTGVTNPRQQVNTISSYIDAWSVYGGDEKKLEWMRQGPVDGDLSNNSAKLLMPDQYLPRRDSRGDVSTAPRMELANANADVAGDVRANENIQLTAVQTLFAREHNRIVDLLPKSLSEEQKFQIARRIVIAEMQYITYNEFLPALGINLPSYRGYDSHVNPAISNEFATVGFRAHSMVHGDVKLLTQTSRYTQARLDDFTSKQFTPTLSNDGKTVEITVPLPAEINNPTLVPELQLGPLLQGIGLKPQYENEEQIENLMRSVNCTPSQGPVTCVSDLGAVDLARGRDNGIPTYNQLRKAYGLPPKTSFKAITGESSEDFPSDPKLTSGNEINQRESLDFTKLSNLFGDSIDLDVTSDALKNDAVAGVRRTPLAARLKAIYGSVGKVDAFTGMLSEAHLPGTEFGLLQKAIWTRQFESLRDGDRFFYGNRASALNYIKHKYGIDYRRSLGDIIANNTDIPRSELPGDVFFVDGQIPPSRCRVDYKVTSTSGSDSGTFHADIRITNNTSRPIDGWALRYRYEDGQKVTKATNGVVNQKDDDVPVTNTAANATIAPGRSRHVGIDGTWVAKKTDPSEFSLNTTSCATG